MNIFQELTDAFDGVSEIDEMNKKYLNTYLLLRSESRDLVVFYQGFAENFHIFKDENGVALKLANNTKYRLFCKFPERILFNHNKKALEFIRLPYRQYRRGICKDNTVIYDPVRVLWGNHVGVTLSHKILQNALKPNYPDNCETAINLLLKRECISVALNAKFAITQSLSKNENLFFLLYSDKCIGFFDITTSKFYIKNKEFRQEVIDNLQLFNPYQMEIS